MRKTSNVKHEVCLAVYHMATWGQVKRIADWWENEYNE